jgi:hypothetical protein
LLLLKNFDGQPSVLSLRHGLARVIGAERLGQAPSPAEKFFTEIVENPVEKIRAERTSFGNCE